jgi:hypothetical protein
VPRSVWLGCAHGGRSGPPRRHSKADVRSSVVVVAEMSVAGEKPPLNLLRTGPGGLRRLLRLYNAVQEQSFACGRPPMRRQNESDTQTHYVTSAAAEWQLGLQTRSEREYITRKAPTSSNHIRHGALQ